MPIPQSDWDFARRLQALTLLNEDLHKTFSSADWLPALHNMLYFIQDAELAIWTNASHTMKRFVDHISTRMSADSDYIYQEQKTSQFALKFFPFFPIPSKDVDI